MSQYDSPDYQRIITLVQGGAMTDAPDWQQVITGPSGGVVPGVVASVDWAPSDLNLVGWSYPINLTDASTSQVMATGTLQAWPVKATAATSITHVGAPFACAGVTFTANQNFMGIYTSSYTSGNPVTFSRAATTAAGAIESTLTASGGMKFFALSSSVAVTAGQVLWVAALVNWTGAINAVVKAIPNNPGLTTTNDTHWKFVAAWESAGPYTTLPASVTFAGITNPTYFMAFAAIY